MTKTNRRAGAVVALAFCFLVGAAAAEPLTPVLDAYFRVQAALADDSMTGVKNEATAIAQAAGQLGAQGRPIVAAARELAGTSAIADARTAFGKLSAALIGYADATKSPLGNDVVTTYCPMAKQTWLQKGEKIRNPHYGKSMLACGVIKKKG